MSYDERSDDLLRAAVNSGTLDIYNEKLDTLLSNLFETAAAGLPNKDIRLSETWTNPRTARIYEHYFDPYEQNADLEAALVEVARFPVPFGELGIVKRLDLSLSDQRTDPPTYPTAPYSAVDDFYDVLWHLRLQPFTGSLPPRGIAGPVIPNLPGFAHPDLPQIQYLWYDSVGEMNSTGFSLIVPQAHILRVFVQFPNSSTHRITCIGRIRGYKQRTDTPPSALNAQQGQPVD